MLLVFAIGAADGNKVVERALEYRLPHEFSAREYHIPKNISRDLVFD